ncbi:PDZ and LIM domain protein 3 isoform X2 [Elephas maximus indicus]|uniref:PDZ and LIM domain protein 3 isoform X2 n=1 Tax=Elephas maximus indicus TaxID=99487 RepID=UPI0021166D77|nr:PDZ and LIM domain protein 3 isoform X2 [Elephas maximus indicus]
MPQNVILPGPAPWGFRLSGGIDFNQPLVITRITPGSKAAAANLCPGDVIVAIDGFGTESMTHADAQDRIKAAVHQLCLKIDRADTHLWSPQVTEDGKAHPFKINLESEPQEFKPIGTAHNRRAQPFVAAANIDDKRQVVSASYNSPIGLYSTSNIQDALHGQLRGLIPSSPQNEPVASVPPRSDVYQMLHHSQDEPAQPRQSGSFRVLQEMVNDDRPAGTRSVRAPVTKAHGGAGGAQKMPLCDKCGSGIVCWPESEHDQVPVSREDAGKNAEVDLSLGLEKGLEGHNK